MNVSLLVSRIQAKLVGEHITYAHIEDLLDDVVDDINSRLNATFPVFSELRTVGGTAPPESYDAFPDKYLRSVVTSGVAYKFYSRDEEGIRTASDYANDYEYGMFCMIRDYMDQIPEEFRAPTLQGSYTADTDMAYPVPERPLTEVGPIGEQE